MSWKQVSFQMVTEFPHPQTLVGELAPSITHSHRYMWWITLAVFYEFKEQSTITLLFDKDLALIVKVCRWYPAWPCPSCNVFRLARSSVWHYLLWVSCFLREDLVSQTGFPLHCAGLQLVMAILSWRCAASFWTANRHYNNWKTGSCAALSSSQMLLSSTKAAVESCSPRWWSQSMATGWDSLESQPITLLNYLSQSHLNPKTLLLNNVLNKCAWTQWAFYKQIFTVEQQYKHSFAFTPRLNGCNGGKLFKRNIWLM